MLHHSLILLTSLLAVAFSIPTLIQVAIKKRLFDDPSEARKVHTKIIPNLGGVAVFSGFLFSTSLFVEGNLLPEAGVVLAAGIVLFTVGLKDDLVGMSPVRKLVAQILSASLVAGLADVRIKSMYGVLGVHDLAYPVSIILTVFIIVAVVNAFNLVDGIDGLSGGLGVVVSLTYAVLFYMMGHFGWSGMAVALAGALLGFLYHNISPARIFMGDAGSLLVGLIAAVLSVKFIGYADQHPFLAADMGIFSAPALAVSVLIVPLFDTTRVFTLRILKGQSPFIADRNHLHHRLLDLGFSHTQSTSILVATTLLFVVGAYFLQPIGNMQLMIVVILAIALLNTLLTLYISQRKRQELARFYDQSVDLSPSSVRKVDNKKFAEDILKKINKN